MRIALFSFMPVIMIPDPKMEIEEQVEGNYSIWGSDDTPPRGRRNRFDKKLFQEKLFVATCALHNNYRHAVKLLKLCLGL